MNGVHDLGGMHGFGPVYQEADEPVFHHGWERRVFGMLLALRLGNVDEFRHAIERMDPAHYLGSSYYEHWLAAIETLLDEKGLLSLAELEAKLGGKHRARSGATAAQEPLAAASDAANLADDQPRREPRFHVGQAVMARNLNPVGHTRLPRYVRGKRGTVVADHGIFTFPDTNAHHRGQHRQHVYNVHFEARELWGEADGEQRSAGRDSLHIDLWEDYLTETTVEAREL